MRDTVRETEAEIEGGEEGSAEGRGEMRGEESEGDAKAYQFGETLGHDARYQNRSFETVEPDARSDFEQHNLGDWARHREAVRRGYEHARRAA